MTKLVRFARCGFAGALAAAVALIAISPAVAGEITGNGKRITIQANSLCAYSGRNDTPNGLSLPIGPNGALVEVDPGGDVQSYGFFKSHTDFIGSPSDPDARNIFAFPGVGCNPTE